MAEPLRWSRLTEEARRRQWLCSCTILDQASLNAKLHTQNPPVSYRNQATLMSDKICLTPNLLLFLISKALNRRLQTAGSTLPSSIFAMPPSNQQSPAHKELLSPANPVALRPHDRVSSDFDRSRLGIPAENDEYNRGLIFFFDPSTGQPSVPSTCEESDVLGETPPYQPSRSSDHSSSCKINTPQSVSDIPGGLQPRAVASASVGLSDGESSECGADHPYPPVSARASVGAIEAPPSPETIQEATSLLTAGSSTVTAMSPTLGPSLAEASDPLGDMSGPQAIIHINQNDVGFLEKIMSAPLSDQMDLLHYLTRQSITPPHPEAIRNSEAKREETQRTVAVRKPKCPRPRLDPMGPRLTTKDTTDKEKVEKAKLMRRIGVCLPCLVNHEGVSCSQKILCLSLRPALTPRSVTPVTPVTSV